MRLHSGLAVVMTMTVVCLSIGSRASGRLATQAELSDCRGGIGNGMYWCMNRVAPPAPVDCQTCVATASPPSAPSTQYYAGLKCSSNGSDTDLSYVAGQSPGQYWGKWTNNCGGMIEYYISSTCAGTVNPFVPPKACTRTIGATAMMTTSSGVSCP